MAGTAFLKDYAVVAGIMSAIVAVLTSLMTFLNPNDFNQSLETANKNNRYLLKPAIRLAKFWNAKAGYVYDSFQFEKWIMGQSYYLAINQRDYLFTVFDNLNTYCANEQWRRDKIERAKKIVAEVRQLEKDGYPYLAEAEVKKLIPV